MEKAELVALIAGRTSYSPAWIEIHYRAFGEVLGDILASDQYEQVVARERSNAGQALTHPYAMGPAVLLLWDRAFRPRTRDLTAVQWLRLSDILAAQLVADVAGGTWPSLLDDGFEQLPPEDLIV